MKTSQAAGVQKEEGVVVKEELAQSRRQDPAEAEEGDEEEEEMPSRDPSPEPPGRRPQRVQDKTGKPPRVREEL